MADLTFTASNVTIVSGATVRTGIAGAAITPGMPLYKDSSASNVLKPADADASATAAIVGIAVNTAANGQHCTYAENGSINCGTILTAGEPYYVSTNAGALCPHDDLGSGDFVSLAGIASSTSVLELKLFDSQNVI